MIGILKRWRQFGRRYFWPHLLWGMVAATLGVPSLANAEQPRPSAQTITLQRLIAAHHSHVSLQLLSGKRRGQGVDYWHQYAPRIAIRQLSSHLAPSHAQYRLSAEQQRQHLVLLSSLSSLLTRQPTLYVTPPYSRPSRCVPSSHGHLPALWLARVQGIRAGPAVAA
ncbi:secA translation cis-regulator SecM [Edwardsiella piscicida]|uniref:secA translation cis-regulator SecM n=1 Tax=Edwardsiella piscicida TaxID=1263550 RepID=UPI001CEC5C43|nr:secA translation cis-regulator SecM [Edwardsiella piscicida]AOP42139.2 secA translation cis-regulator SecM [Edwardsiella piscicida]UCQ58217.1 secA translation cis-regulator SecM [Edwardsiella piscicida]